MAVFKFCVRNNAVYLSPIPVSMFHKQWGLMKPGLHGACPCPCVPPLLLYWFSSLLGTDFIKPVSLCLSTMCSLGVLQGLLQRLSYPSSPLPSAASWETTPLVTVWHQVCWHLLSSASQLGLSCPLKLKKVRICLSCASIWKTHAVFLVLTSLKLAWNC